MVTSNMKLMGSFRMKLWLGQALSEYFHKMVATGHFGFPIFAQMYMVLPPWVTNGCVKFEFDMEIGVTVT